MRDGAITDKIMKGFNVAVLVIVLVVLGYFILAVDWGDRGEDATGYGNNGDNNSAMGSVVFSVTDATAEIENVNEVRLELGGAELYSATRGWVRVSSDDVEYKLIELREVGVSKIYATANVAADTYSKVRVELKKATLEWSDKMSSETKEAILLTNNIEFNSNVVVTKGSTSSVELDFIASESLHTSTDGEYVFAPVVEVEVSSGANVEVDSTTGTVVTTGGTITSDISIGTDIDGSVKTNFKLDADVEINLDGEVKLLNSSSGNVTGDVNSNVDSALEGKLNI